MGDLYKKSWMLIKIVSLSATKLMLTQYANWRWSIQLYLHTWEIKAVEWNRKLYAQKVQDASSCWMTKEMLYIYMVRIKNNNLSLSFQYGVEAMCTRGAINSKMNHVKYFKTAIYV